MVDVFGSVALALNQTLNEAIQKRSRGTQSGAKKTGQRTSADLSIHNLDEWQRKDQSHALIQLSLLSFDEFLLEVPREHQIVISLHCSGFDFTDYGGIGPQCMRPLLIRIPVCRIIGCGMLPPHHCKIALPLVEAPRYMNPPPLASLLNHLSIEVSSPLWILIHF